MLRVLILDDEEAVARTVASMMQRSLSWLPGSEFAFATRPREALQLVESLPRDGKTLVVVSDYNLRDSMTGIAFLAGVAARRSDAVRVLISGYDPADFAERGSAGIVDYFIQKPFGGAEATELVRLISEGPPDLGRRPQTIP